MSTHCPGCGNTLLCDVSGEILIPCPGCGHEAVLQSRKAEIEKLNSYYDDACKIMADKDAELAALRAQIERISASVGILGERDVRLRWAEGEVCPLCNHALCTTVRALRAERQ